MKNLPDGQQLFNIIFGFLALAVVVNLIWVNWKLAQPAPATLVAEGCDLVCVGNEVKKIVTAELGKLAIPTPQPATTIETCDRDCVEQVVDAKLAALPTAAKTTTVAKPKVTSAPKTSFVNLASGTAAGTSWTGISGTELWLDTSLYAASVVGTWEGQLKIQDGNGLGYARLYDITNNRGVDGSEVQVSGTDTISFYSGNLALWRGQNQYRIEVRSTTGYPVTVSSARIKLVY